MSLTEDERRAGILLARQLVDIGMTGSMEVTMFAAGVFLSYAREAARAFPGEGRDELISMHETAHKEGQRTGSEIWQEVSKTMPTSVAGQITRALEACGISPQQIESIEVVDASALPCPTECPEWDTCDKKVVAN